jgi:hypothetical protein
MVVITLTTDFGLRDAYVAAMKGVALGINPQAALVDISHDIEPQVVAQAAFVLETVHRYFLPGTVHLVVVDLGAGTQRRALVLKTPAAVFVVPDNGVLSYVIEAAGREADGTFHGRILHIDAFGNLITNIGAGDCRRGAWS